MNTAPTLQQIYETLHTAYGPQSWWPADTPFEVMVGAILTQNTAWTNVEKAIASLGGVCDLTPGSILDLDLPELEEAIRPSGYFRQKAHRLQGFCRFLLDRYGGDPGSMGNRETGSLREELLSLKGIGPETADSILLYALDKPVFVVDAYTIRLVSRLGLCDGKAAYHDVQALFMDDLTPDAPMFNEYHALIVRHCKQVCSKREPGCGGCAIADMCAWNLKFNIKNLKKS